MKRCTRLFRPVFYYFGFWAVALTVLFPCYPGMSTTPSRRQHPAVLVSWRLVLVLAAMPVLYRITATSRFTAGVVTVYGIIAAIDAIRLYWHASAPSVTSTWPSGSSQPCSASPTAAGCSPPAPRWASRDVVRGKRRADPLGAVRLEHGRHR